MKKSLSLMLLFLSLTTFVFAQAATEQSQAKETRVFTDSLGREIEIPAVVEKVAPSGNVAQLAIYAIAPEKMVGWSSRISNSAMDTFLPDAAELPVFGAFYGSKANLNKEALVVADPDVVIDVGEIKGSKEKMTKELDELSKSIGIPVIFVEGYLENTDTMFISLGEILNKEEEAKVLADYTRKALDKGIENRDSISSTVYYSSSPDGLSAIQKGSFHGEVIEFIGADNIVPETFSGSNGTTSLEQIYLWDPDVILLSNNEAYELALTDKTWGELRAVQEGRVYLIPTMPYPFIDAPPATNRIIGIYWLGNVLAPDVYTEDIAELTKSFYELFYHISLTDSEVYDILHI